MPLDRSVLVLDGSDGPRAALADRLRRLGFRTLRAKTPEEAFRLVEEHRYAISAALVPPFLPVMNLGDTLCEMVARSLEGALQYVATGVEPDDGTRTELRDAGVLLALWEPFGDAMLRFQVNQALAGILANRPRHEPRAPVEVDALVHHAGREKRARIYTLSTCGAYLETQRPSVRNAALRIETELGGERVALPARVVHTNVPGNLQKRNLPVGMAVRFGELPEAVTSSIREMVARSMRTLLV